MADTATDAARTPPYAFTHAGATLVAEESGTGPRTFLVVHGIGMGRSVFGDLRDKLDSHARVIAIDQPGYGEAPEPSRTLTMERTADLVAAYIRHRRLDRRPQNMTLVGHSMGTQVVTEIAARHPNLAGRIVLVAPTVNVRERSAVRQVLRMAQDLAVESPKVFIVGGREYLRAGPHLRRKLRAMLVHRPEDAYPRVRVPALVLRGEHDYVCPRPWCLQVTGALPHGTFTEVEGHGHETMIRDAEDAASRILAFAAEKDQNGMRRSWLNGWGARAGSRRAQDARRTTARHTSTSG